eukprot:SAG31_NODE_2326_length_5940_cov_2.687896_4_plen_82_part_00
MQVDVASSNGFWEARRPTIANCMEGPLIRGVSALGRTSHLRRQFRRKCVRRTGARGEKLSLSKYNYQFSPMGVSANLLIYS